jgi:hypothetical protein
MNFFAILIAFALLVTCAVARSDNNGGRSNSAENVGKVQNTIAKQQNSVVGKLQNGGARPNSGGNQQGKKTSRRPRPSAVNNNGRS